MQPRRLSVPRSCLSHVTNMPLDTGAGGKARRRRRQAEGISQ